MTQIKEQDKFPENQLNYMETGNLPEKEFRIMTVKMIQDVGKKMEKMQVMFTKDQELTNKQTEMNNTLEAISNRIPEAEEQKNDPEDRMVEITAAKQNVGGEMKKMKTA